MLCFKALYKHAMLLLISRYIVLANCNAMPIAFCNEVLLQEKDAYSVISLFLYHSISVQSFYIPVIRDTYQRFALGYIYLIQYSVILYTLHYKCLSSMGWLGNKVYSIPMHIITSHLAAALNSQLKYLIFLQILICPHPVYFLEKSLACTTSSQVS